MDVPVIVLGWSSGNPLVFDKPVTCDNGCRLYPALPAFFLSPLPPGTKQFSFPIPNNPSPFQTCYSVQTAHGDPFRGCIHLHGALSFCVGR